MFTASRSALTSALALTSDIVERRNTIPILSNVLFERDADSMRQLMVRMSDLDIEARVTLAAEVQASFTGFTVPGHMLSDIVRKLPDGADVAFAPAQATRLDGITLKSGRSKFSLQVLSAADFPELPMPAASFRFEADAKALAEALSSVSFAISTEETRYYLNGVFLEQAEEGVLLVATDGHRLAKRFLRADAMEGSTPGIIIPRKTVKVLHKVLPKEGRVSISATDSLVRVALPGLTISSKLIDGTFPDYRRVIPSQASQRAEIEAQALRAAVDRVATISGERGRGARFAFAGCMLTLTVTNPDSGTAEEELAVSGDIELATGFNVKYVLDALAHLPDGTVTLSIEDPGSPAILRADGDIKENLVVLMPMRI